MFKAEEKKIKGAGVLIPDVWLRASLDAGLPYGFVDSWLTSKSRL